MKTERTSDLVASIFILSLATNLFAAEALEKPGFWVREQPPRMSVKVDNVRRYIDVSLVKEQDLMPRSIGITFFDPKGVPTLVELKPLEGATGHYQGALDPSAQSSMGFEVQIPFGSKTPKRFKSSELKKLSGAEPIDIGTPISP